MVIVSRDCPFALNAAQESIYLGGEEGGTLMAMMIGQAGTYQAQS